MSSPVPSSPSLSVLLPPSVTPTNRHLTTINDRQHESGHKKINPDDVPLTKKVIFSGISGAIATTCIYPIDICKTKLMNQKGVGVEREFKGPLDTFIKLWTREGVKGLYRGWSDITNMEWHHDFAEFDTN